MTVAAGKATPGPVLCIEELSLAFGGLSVLDSVSLSVYPNEVLGLIGPNGAGKTALLNCISGVYRPSRGSRLSLNGRRIDHLPAHRITSLGIARTFQHVDLLPGLNVIDNVLVGLAAQMRRGILHRLLRPVVAAAAERNMRSRARDALDQCRLEHLEREDIQGLPLGSRRRIDLARALVSRPTLLLLDEPASGLGQEERALIPDLIGIARAERDVGVIWIEHDLDLVISSADRVAVMHHGQIIADGQPRASGEERRALIDAYMHGDTVVPAGQAQGSKP